jgi:two-component system osmolarity sensor histidine kinase EnvZ
MVADLPDTIGWRGDPVDLRRVGANLIDNALRHAIGPDGRVSIRILLSASQRGIRLVVGDNGPGIPPELHASALRPFSRLDAARTDHGQQGAGSGLGLAIVSRIARRYDGDARLDSSEQGGLRVSVDLPDAR